jgi:hypothetical protein
MKIDFDSIKNILDNRGVVYKIYTDKKYIHSKALEVNANKTIGLGFFDLDFKDDELVSITGAGTHDFILIGDSK